MACMVKSDMYIQVTALLASGARQDAELLLKTHRNMLSDAEYKECLGNLHFYRKEYDKAISFYESATESSEEYHCARFHYLAGVQAEQAGRLSDAFKYYQAAIGIEPTFVDSYVELGGLLGKVGDFEGALQCYSDAIAIDSTDLGLRHNLVEVLSQLAKKNPSAYSQPLNEAQLSYDTAKKTLTPPDGGRVW